MSGHRRVRSNWRERRAWVAVDSNECFAHGVVDEDAGGKLTVRLEDGRTIEAATEDTQAWSSAHEDDLDDVCNMDDLCEPALLKALERRFMIDKIYTFAGDVLVSLNPYQMIPVRGAKRRCNRVPDYFFSLFFCRALPAGPRNAVMSTYSPTEAALPPKV